MDHLSYPVVPCLVLIKRLTIPSLSPHKLSSAYYQFIDRRNFKLVISNYVFMRTYKLINDVHVYDPLSGGHCSYYKSQYKMIFFVTKKKKMEKAGHNFHKLLGIFLRDISFIQVNRMIKST